MFVLSSLVIAAALAPGLAWANAGIPAVGYSFWLNLVLFPLILLIEGWVYRRGGLAAPFRLAAGLNAFSSLLGVALSFPLGVFMLPTSASLRFQMLAEPSRPVWGAVATFFIGNAFLFTACLALTLWAEGWLHRRLRPEEGAGAEALRLRANLISYAVISVPMWLGGGMLVATALGWG